jgi:hypothetical protein
MLTKCHKASGAVSCGPVVAGAVTWVNEKDCAATKEALVKAVDEYSRGTSAATLACTVGGAVKVQQSCAETAGVLNRALGSFIDGTFEGCHLSTQAHHLHPRARLRQRRLPPHPSPHPPPPAPQQPDFTAGWNATSTAPITTCVQLLPRAVKSKQVF